MSELKVSDKFTMTVKLYARELHPLCLKIISGGQTGADRGGLRAAILLGLDHGGWCPKGRRAEDGEIPACYRLQETRGAGYRARTVANVRDSDATVVFTRGSLTPGSRNTLEYAAKLFRPALWVDLDKDTAQDLSAWLLAVRPLTLNVAGSRESRAPGIEAEVESLLVKILSSGK